MIPDVASVAGVPVTLFFRLGNAARSAGFNTAKAPAVKQTRQTHPLAYRAKTVSFAILS